MYGIGTPIGGAKEGLSGPDYDPLATPAGGVANYRYRNLRRVERPIVRYLASELLFGSRPVMVFGGCDVQPAKISDV
jgi:hypothetical protein